MKAKIIEEKIDALIPDNLNANKGTEYGEHLVDKSFRELGAGRSVLLDRNNKLIAGNKSVLKCAEIGLNNVIIVETDGTQLVAVKRIDLDLDSKKGRELAIADNASAKANIEWDPEAINAISNTWGVDVEEWGVELPVLEEQERHGEGDAKAKLAESFIVPPFSVLDSRQGYWQERKQAWRQIIGDHGESRTDTLITSPEMKYKGIYQKSMAERKKLGIGFREYLEKYVSEEEKAQAEKSVMASGVSILDPVLSEIIVHWFGLPNGSAFDCFSGDSVFGFVSAYLGQKFTGIELRKEQADLNNQRVQSAGLTAQYHCDDGQNVLQYIPENSQNLFFSCPPYFDLEVYSDHPSDASNQKTYEGFLKVIETAFLNSIRCLKDNRFAVIVVGDVRSKKTGEYYDLPSDIKRIFKAAGMLLYNEIILIEPLASTALRAAKYMETRKVAKAHQNVMVFYKGDPRKIKENFPRIDYINDFSNGSEGLEY